MAEINCVLDTTPMAQSIDTVSHHVDGTTSAVVAMKVAVIEAEYEAATHVINNVNRGFYSMIHSQISQKIATLKSDVDSWYMQLYQKRKQLEAIRDRMERDYYMISARYTKLFNSLNRNLRDRIMAVDEPIMKLVLKDAERTDSRPASLTALVPLMQQEAITNSQTILASEVKYKGVEAIETMSNFLASMKRQDELSRKILLPKQLNEDSRMMFIPVVVTESNFDSTGATVVNIYGDAWVPSRGMEQLRVEQASFAWQPDKKVDATVANDFHRRLAESSASQRVKEMAAWLFSKNDISTL